MVCDRKIRPQVLLIVTDFSFVQLLGGIGHGENGVSGRAKVIDRQ